jgi:hypothetical protein
LFTPKSSSKIEILENVCIFWLLMLEYKGGRLKGLRFPSEGEIVEGEIVEMLQIEGEAKARGL